MNLSEFIRLSVRVHTVLLLLVFGGCQSKMPLMPTPEALKDPRLDVFAANPAPMTSNEFKTFYVTTRSPAAADSTNFFTAEPDDKMHFGYATTRLGSPDFDMTTLLAESTTAAREDDLFWTVLDAPVLASLPVAELSSMRCPSNTASRRTIASPRPRPLPRSRSGLPSWENSSNTASR